MPGDRVRDCLRSESGGSLAGFRLGGALPNVDHQDFLLWETKVVCGYTLFEAPVRRVDGLWRAGAGPVDPRTMRSPMMTWSSSDGDALANPSSRRPTGLE